MNYYVAGHLDKDEKEEIEKKGLYCYDLRESDFDNDIDTIEEHVWVNKIGVIITDEKLNFGKYLNDFISYMDFILNHNHVSRIEDMFSNKSKQRTRQLDDNMYVMDLGYRNNEPIALVERTTQYGKEYIIGFNYEIKDNKIQWGYGYYYNENITKAKEDFKKVLAGGNLADTFNEEKKVKRKNLER